MLTSTSATERNRLWDKYKGPVDQDAIKLDFFRKVHRKNPPFRTKVKLGPRNKVKVPLMVKEHYKKPVELLPSLQSVLRLETLKERTDSLNEYDSADELETAANNKYQDHKNGIVKFNNDNAECNIFNGDDDEVHSVKPNIKCGRSVDICDILSNCKDVNNLNCNNNTNVEDNCIYNGTQRYEAKAENCGDTDLSLDGIYKTYLKKKGKAF